jgi:hypothetical protein
VKSESKNNGVSGRPSSKTQSAKVRVRDIVAERPGSELRELYNFWAAKDPNDNLDEEKLRAQIAGLMCDDKVAAARVASFGQRMGVVVDRFLEADNYRLGFQELAAASQLSYLSQYDLEACLVSLARHGFLVEGEDPRFSSYGQRSFALSVEVGDAVIRARRTTERGIFDVLTLRGYLDELYADPERAARTTPRRQREMYKLYSRESASVARIERLPDGVRELIEKSILEFGGVLPRSLFERMDTELPHWNGRRWRLILEKSLVGSVQRVDLTRYGILHDDETLVVFNEVALAWLRHVAVPGDPDAPHEELSLGIDLVSNLSRFLGIIQSSDVRFTVKGEIFKTTEKKIVQQLIPNPGRELSREEVLAFVFRFARHANLIDNTGERTFSVTTTGREWETRPLAEKLEALVDFATDEQPENGEPYHQASLREIFMRLLKRVDAGTWYDLMYLPFLARNTYLASMDDLAVEEYFDERSRGAHYTPMSDPQRMAWNLVKWVRQRLYLLGIVDLGYDKSGRPVAMRLTRSGARLLGIVDNEAEEAHALGNLVVTPDFEVVLFPSGDDAELIHDLDRFCVREKQGHLHHFRIQEESVRRALTGGMHLRTVLDTLQRHSRTPVPQNVLYSIRDWAARAGLMLLDEKLVVHCEDPEALRRFCADSGARTHIAKELDERSVKLKGRHSQKRMQSLLRDLGFLVEPV